MKLQRYIVLGACALSVHTGYADLEGSLSDLRNALFDLTAALGGDITPLMGQGTPPPLPPRNQPPTGGPSGNQPPLTPQDLTGGTPPPPPPPGMGGDGTKKTWKQLQEEEAKKEPKPKPKPTAPTGSGMTMQDILAQGQKLKKQQQSSTQGTTGESPQMGPQKLAPTGPKPGKGAVINAPEIPKTLGVKFKVFANRIETDLPQYTINVDTGKIGPTITQKNRDNAKSILTELTKDINSGKLNVTTQDVKAVVTLLERIVYVDPLLINQVHALMRKIGLSDKELRDFIVKLYDLRVRYVEHEFKQIEDRSKLNNVWQVQKGTADDLDEGLEFAFSLEGLTQEARLTKTTEGKKFADDIDALRQRLLDLLMSIPQKHWEDLEKQGLPIATYVAMLKTPKQAFCVVAEGKDEVFYPFAVDLAELSRQIDAYSKPLTKKSVKAFMIESIIKKLQGFYKYTHIEPGQMQVCSTCLNYEHELLKYMKTELERGASAATIVDQITQGNVKVRSEQRVKPVFGKDGSLAGKVPLEKTDVVNYDTVLTKIKDFLTDLNKKLNRDDILVVIDYVIPHIRNVIKSGSCQ